MNHPIKNQPFSYQFIFLILVFLLKYWKYYFQTGIKSNFMALTFLVSYKIYFGFDLNKTNFLNFIKLEIIA